MTSSSSPRLPSLTADIRLFGKVDDHMLGEFFRQQQEALRDKPIVVELSTGVRRACTLTRSCAAATSAKETIA